MALKYDIYFEPVTPGTGFSKKMFTFGYRSAVKAAGPAAMVDRWLKVFMTRQGTDPLDLTYGTTFPSLIGGNVSDFSSISDIVRIAVAEATAQLRKIDVEGQFPLNEQIRDAALLEIRDTGDSGVEFWVQLTNGAGQQLPIRISQGEVR